MTPDGDIACASYEYDPGLDALALQNIVSLKRDEKGNKLVVRVDGKIVVARAGPNPLAWARTDRKREKNESPKQGWKPVRPVLDDLLIGPERLLAALAHTTAKARAEFEKFHRDRPPTTWDESTVLEWKSADQQQAALLRILRKAARARRVDVSHYVSNSKGKLTRAGSELADQYRRRQRLANLSADAWDEQLRRQRCFTLRHAILIHRRGAMLREWLAGFPGEALAYLDRCGFKERRWHVLNLWLRIPAGRELFHDFPQLAWMLASSWIFKSKPVKRPFRSLRALVRKPRAALLVWLGLPKGEGTLKLLRRMPCHLLNGHNASRLGKVLRHDQARKWLQNLPGPLDPHVLGFLAFGHPVSFQLLHAMLEEPYLPQDDPYPRPSLREIFVEVEHWLNQFDFLEDATWLASIRSPARLRALHDELAARITDEADSEIRSAWPGHLPPPLAPEPWMRPLASYDDLKNEGRIMNHCVATRASQVVGGMLYIYAILHPAGRATLAISKERKPQRWTLEELRGPNNQAVPDPVREDLQMWLDRENKAPGAVEDENQLLLELAW
jgi:hypothetical protein